MSRFDADAIRPQYVHSRCRHSVRAERLASRVARALDIQRVREPLAAVLERDGREVLNEHCRAHDAAEDVQRPLRQELRPDDARVAVAEVPALIQRRLGVHLHVLADV